MPGIGGLVEHVALGRQRERKSEGAQDRSRDAYAEQDEFAAISRDAQRLGADVADALDGVDPGEISDFWMSARVDDGGRPLASVDVDRCAGVENGKYRWCGVDRWCGFAAQNGPYDLPTMELTAASTAGVDWPLEMILLSQVSDTCLSAMAPVSVPSGWSTASE